MVQTASQRPKRPFRVRRRIRRLHRHRPDFTAIQIAEELNCDLSYVYDVLGDSILARWPKPESKADKIVQLLKGNWSVSKISDHLSVSKTYVYSVRKRAREEGIL